MRRRILALVLGLGMGLVASTSLANDSTAELALGGLVLRQSANIAMKSEDLFISREQIRVSYVYRNNSSRPITTIVAFPLPDVDYGQESEMDVQTIVGDSGDSSIIPFTTLVDGRSVPFNTELRAFVGNREITARLSDLRLPPLMTNQAITDQFQERVGQLDARTRSTLIREGLIKDTGNAFNRFQPNWRTKINIWRNQTFPAGRDVRVEHRYAPLIGGSVDSGLRADYDRPALSRYRRDYCVDDAFLAALDRRLNSRTNKVTVMETWLGYILTSGANWSGPIGRFTLTIDKGKPDDLVSFCETGVRSISPTQFQVTKTNFTPRRDLKVLFLYFPPLNE